MKLCVIDNFVDAAILRKINEEWPAVDWPGWIRYDPSQQHKWAYNTRARVPESISGALYKMASMQLPAWCDAGLVPDLGLWGGGLHEMPVGKGVNAHIDAGKHAMLGLARVLSAILYVHEEWRSTWGGRLLIGTDSIKPVPGRLVLFDCRALLHEVEEVNASAVRNRRSLAMFWYSDVAGDLPERAVFAKE